MKRTAVVGLLAMAMSTTVFADLAIRYSSSTFFIKNGEDGVPHPDDYLPANALHVLIWSPTAAPVFAYAKPGTGVGDGDPLHIEYVLYSSNVDELRGPPGDKREDSGRFFYSASPFEFTDADVGGRNINNGYFYSRIFSTSGAEAGSWYFQTQAVVGPTLAEYSITDINSVYSHIASDINIDPTRTMGVGTGMYQVIPEPATGVLALTALGMLIYRRRRSPLSAVRHRE